MTTTKLLLGCLFGLFIFGLCVLTFCTSGCGYARHVDPPIYTYDTAKLTELSARAHAKDPGCKLYHYDETGTNSMVPLIIPGDWVVTEITPFRDDLLGHVCVYLAQWRQGREVMHRLVSGNATDGFIASGDNNQYSEPTERVRPTNYVSEVVAIYRTKTS